jgi:hypothetical protein
MITGEEENDNHQQLPPVEANDGEAHAILLANNIAAPFGCNFLFL